MIKLTCPKCSKQVPLTDEDAFQFYPRFFCLACGEKIDIPIKPEDYAKQTRATDRDRHIETNGKK